jgi:hypothetical protein
MKKIIFLLVILLLYNVSEGQSGTLDPSFGNNGYILTSATPSGNTFSPIPRQCFVHNDGKIFLVLQANNKTKITRRLLNGNIDLSYGNNGYSVVI